MRQGKFFAIGAIAALLMAACFTASCLENGDEDTVRGSLPDNNATQEEDTLPADLFIQVQGAVFVEDDLPEVDPGGPDTLELFGPGFTIRGGTYEFAAIREDLTDPSAARAYVTLYDATGYFEIPLDLEKSAKSLPGSYEMPAGFTDTPVTISILPTPEECEGLYGVEPCHNVDLEFHVGVVDGTEFGPWASIEPEMIPVGNGDLQVSLAFDQRHDLDLHVWEPDGAHIYFGDRASASGGELDLDSNAGCSIDGKNNENVFWPAGNTPAGTYTVQVHSWSFCSDPLPVNYFVTVLNRGQIGTFEGSFAVGEEGVYRDIVTFDFE